MKLASIMPRRCLILLAIKIINPPCPRPQGHRQGDQIKILESHNTAPMARFDTKDDAVSCQIAGAAIF